MKYQLEQLQSNYIRAFDLMICLPFLIAPLLVSLPYRVNLYLSWEGAYRLMIGQVPYADFGLPMGFGYWIIPAVFFKIFGPELVTLVKAQIFINVISLICIRGILYRLQIKPFLISLSLMVFCLTYVIYNFWPWYNHTVVVFELVGLYFLILYITGSERRLSIGWVVMGAVFIFLSFFTKQDAGGVAFFLGVAIMAYHSYKQRQVLPVAVYVASFIAIGLVLTVPFLEDGFLYWFNYGQPPHNSRVGVIPLVDVVFSEKAMWEKLYLVIILLVIISAQRKHLADFFSETRFITLFILTIGLIGQAVITRVTSPLPTDHMTYFHVFAIALIVLLSERLYESVSKYSVFAVMAVTVVLVFSGGYWKYVKGVMGLNVSKEDSMIPRRSEPWAEADVTGFKGMLLPKETLQGVDDLLQSDVAQKENLKVLNMSELTPLALKLDYEPPVSQPLWYHLNIGIFQKEVDLFCDRVKDEQYDLVLFQDIPGLVHFFPYQVRDTLKTHYKLQDRFLAPRKKENSYVEVYVKKNDL